MEKGLFPYPPPRSTEIEYELISLAIQLVPILLSLSLFFLFSPLLPPFRSSPLHFRFQTNLFLPVGRVFVNPKSLGKTNPPIFVLHHVIILVELAFLSEPILYRTAFINIRFEAESRRRAALRVPRVQKFRPISPLSYLGRRRTF